MSKRAKVYLTCRLPRPVLDELKRTCGEFDMNDSPDPASRETLLEGVKDREAVICLLNDRIDAEVFDAAGPQCRIFANYGVGFNNIDLEEAEKRGVLISNTPDILNDATADLAWALLFAAARRVAEGDRLVRNSSFAWAPEFMLGANITGQTLGVIGPGRIGRNFARKSRGFDMKVLYTGHRPSPEFEAETGGKFVSLDELLKASDFVALHVPLTPETRHMIGERELSLMKPTAVLVNTARGPVIDEKALVRALKNGTIWGAGLDVYENEPQVEPELKTMDNVVLTPHVGSATNWTRTEMGMICVRNVAAALEGKEPPTRVRLKK